MLLGRVTAPGSVPVGRDGAVFLDRDGVINRRRSGHVTCWSDFSFMPGALRALRLLAAAGAHVVVVTNQSAVGRGLLTAEGLAAIHARMARVAARAGGEIAAVYACPHTPEAGCGCRKPGIGLLSRAAGDRGIDLRGSVLIGDSPSDVEAARAAGCRPIAVADALPLPVEIPCAPDLLHAVALLANPGGVMGPERERRRADRAGGGVWVRERGPA
ncbi:MAG: HAD-IIIA family hydrolase [Candidatus Dormibacteraeota bacterium]|nr:HAD-IIIA family hydrolase [Candidatus Dormibacteraeota bacterium]MBO0704620.1 HAD-IIIA family hydrolase [Candidatus Dormibacteraeota bacterium]MBO0761650.1 HAD-IIIA family hydrolase [Candidatus Dormibacteraeota bacterium]